MTLDEQWMRRALALAEKGRGHVHPNPMVGAVLVRAGRVVGEGYHRKYGGPHAEIEALRDAGSRARGSTLYLNLEPCGHWGKTPPCTGALVQAGIRGVVAAMRDPNPLVAGSGFSYLKRHGVRIRTGIMQAEAMHLNRGFATWVTKKRPYVTLKIATSLDGRSATITGESKWITGPHARRYGHRLRAEADAVAVGSRTVIKDNPSLTAHGQGPNPVRIVFAGKHPLPRRSKIFSHAAPTWVLRGSKNKTGLRLTLSGLADRGVCHLLVEGGQTLQRSFLEAGLVDEVVWFLAPMIVGNAKHLEGASRIRNLIVGRMGDDLCLQGALD